MAGGVRPQWRLAALDKETEDTSHVGVAWNKDNGSISIKLNAFVHLIGNKNLVLTLFPSDDERSVTSPKRQAGGGPGDPDDPTPF